MNVVVMGPPGSGKGTQCQLMAAHWNLAHISMGEKLRNAVSSDEELAFRIKTLMSQGSLVPDSIVVKLLELSLAQAKRYSGVVFDGFPRTDNQASALEQLLSQRKSTLDLVVELIVDPRELSRRLLHRRRSDDIPSVISSRFEIYDNEIEPVREFYRERRIYEKLHADNSVSVVSEHINHLIDQVAAKRPVLRVKPN